MTTVQKTASYVVHYFIPLHATSKIIYYCNYSKSRFTNR